MVLVDTTMVATVDITQGTTKVVVEEGAVAAAAATVEMATTTVTVGY